jgi:hypothetical protein
VPEIVDVPTVNKTPLLAMLPKFTVTCPVVAPAGTVVVTLVSLQKLVVAVVAPKETELAPFWAPK